MRIRRLGTDDGNVAGCRLYAATGASPHDEDTVLYEYDESREMRGDA